MRLAIGLLILLVLASLTWVGIATWNEKSTGVDHLRPRGANATAMEKRGVDALDSSVEAFTETVEQSNLNPLQGRVVGPDGNPVVGARVALMRLFSAWPEWRSEMLEIGLYTDDEGRFQFQSPRSDDLMIEVIHDDLATKRVRVPEALPSLMIRMEHGFEVKGFVGQSARSVLVSLEPSSWSDNKAVSTRTDARGFFRFTNVPAGLARLSVRDRFLPPVTLPTVTVGNEEVLHLRFRRRLMGKSISGVVMRAEAPDQPVIGAEVRVYSSTAWNSGLLVPFLTETDQNGRFIVPGLGKGNLSVEVRHPAFSTMMRIAPRGRRTTRFRFELFPKSRVHGSLQGADLVGTRISLVSGAGEIGWATVDAAGKFTFPELISSGRAVLEIEDGEWAFAESLSRYLDITVREEGETVIDQEVTAPSVLSGRVVDVEGNPLVDVMVSTLRRRVAIRSPERLMTTTGPDGRYAFRGLVVGTVEVFMGSVELVFEREGYAPQYAAVVGSTEQPEIVLVEPGVIAGRVTRGGKPLPGAIVFAGQGKHREITVVTGPDGRYRLGSLAPNSYRVKVRYSTLALQLADRVAEVRSGEVIESIDIDFPTGQIVEGTVLADDEMPIPEASVLATGPFGARIITRTDPSGAFLMEVPKGARELQIVSPDFQIVVQKEIREGRKQGVIHLPMVPRGSVVTRVVGLPGLRPVVAGILRIEPMDDDEGWDENERRQRSVPSRWVEMVNGELRVDDFPMGRSRMTLQCPGFGPDVQEVVLLRNRVLKLPPIELEPGAKLKGRVSNTAGDPVFGAVIHLGEEFDLFQFGARTSFRTDSNGKFEIRGVSPLGKRLVIYAEGYATAVIDLEFPRDLIASEPKSIVLRPASSITVRVEDAMQKPQSSGWVVLMRDGVRLALEEPDEDGRVTFIARGAGTYGVALLGSESASKQVVITDQSRELAVVLRVNSN